MVKKVNPDNLRKPTITFEQLATAAEVPEIPQAFKDQLWRTVRVAREIRITEETEHFMNLMGLHFGLARSEVVIHAINLLWKEVVQSITTDQLRLYEEKLEAMRLFRLEQKEEKEVQRALRKEAGVEKWQRQNPDERRRAYGRCQTWSYQHDRGVVKKKKEDE
jgi:hypothetical protein